MQIIFLQYKYEPAIQRVKLRGLARQDGCETLNQVQVGQETGKVI